MKITKSQLKQIIKEEISKTLSEENRSSVDIAQQLSNMAKEDYLTLVNNAEQNKEAAEKLDKLHNDEEFKKLVKQYALAKHAEYKARPRVPRDPKPPVQYLKMLQQIKADRDKQG